MPNIQFKRTESIGYLVNYMARLFSRTLEQKIKPEGVSIGQLPVLLVLHEEKGLSQVDLCKRILVEQATMANTLQRMERDNLVQRESDPEDKRRFRFYPTEHASTLMVSMMTKGREVNDQAVTGLNEDEQNHLKFLLRKLINNLEQSREVPEK
ncbi:MAG: MarR family transcriptional regulator [Gammaproteobacteria bacterium]|nr:MarR family transcriptional regulator [Gammaproteobacteria bacterium]